MKRFSEQLKKKSETIRMSAAQRRDLRERIVSYMEYHPLENAQTQTVRKDVILSEPFRVFSINKMYARAFAGVFSLFLIIGVPYLAENAVPGDVLYPVKVQFNEEVRSTLSLSPYAKVEWETQRLERRIAEARLLADEGKLTDEIQAEVAIAVKNHTSAAQQGIAALRKSDSDEAAFAEIAFASVLAVQSEVLENRVAGEVEGEEGKGHSILALADAVAGARVSAEAAQENAKPSFEKMLARIESETTRAQELFTSVEADATAEDIASVKRRLADIQRKVTEAIGIQEQNKVVLVSTATATEALPPVEEDVLEETVASEPILEPGDEESQASTTEVLDLPEVENEPEPVEAPVAEVVIDTERPFELLRTALADTRKLISFMTSIDVQANVTVEELVPVELTKEERIDIVASKLEMFTVKQKEIETAVVIPEYREKFSLVVGEFNLSVNAVRAFMEKGALLSAESEIRNAKALLADLLKVMESNTVPVTKTPVETDKSTSTKSSTTESVVETVLDIIE